MSCQLPEAFDAAKPYRAGAINADDAACIRILRSIWRLALRESTPAKAIADLVLAAHAIAQARESIQRRAAPPAIIRRARSRAAREGKRSRKAVHGKAAPDAKAEVIDFAIRSKNA